MTFFSGIVSIRSSTPSESHPAYCPMEKIPRWTSPIIVIIQAAFPCPHDLPLWRPLWAFFRRGNWSASWIIFETRFPHCFSNKSVSFELGWPGRRLWKSLLLLSFLLQILMIGPILRSAATVRMESYPALPILLPTLMTLLAALISDTRRALRVLERQKTY